MAPNRPHTLIRLDVSIGSIAADLGCPHHVRFAAGGLNRSPQHFILEGKDGVWDGTAIS